MKLPTATLRIFRPHPNVIAFYDGRVPGRRLYSPEPNWVDDGAYALGIATFAVVDGEEAIVYDTHISTSHAEAIRRTLIEAGVRHMRVVLSHWHLDHVAGNAVFADCEIIAHAWTAAALAERKDAIEAGTHHGLPAVTPLALPTTTFEGDLPLQVGRLRLELRHVDIHSRDGVVVWLPGEGLLLAGDTLEDTCTYVAEPEGFANHLRDLARMATWPVARILPNHGEEGLMRRGGYGPGFIGATERYVRHLAGVREGLVPAEPSLRKLVADDLASGTLTWLDDYEDVHRRNLANLQEGR